ncbi:hypothetical protein LEP3755_47410 [Leptolyngbya sp. NIES-3755]|nr:hypothetical protein LEP3755_47410 [Leptolyngbya sp. NIES-3755]
MSDDDRFNQMENRVDRAENQIIDLRLAVSAMIEHGNQMQENFRVVASEIQTLRSISSDVLSQILSLQTQVLTIQTQMIEMRSQSIEMQSQMVEMRSQSIEMQSQMVEMQSQIRDLHSSNNQILNEMQRRSRNQE